VELYLYCNYPVKFKLYYVDRRGNGNIRVVWLLF